MVVEERELRLEYCVVEKSRVVITRQRIYQVKADIRASVLVQMPMTVRVDE